MAAPPTGRFWGDSSSEDEIEVAALGGRFSDDSSSEDELVDDQGYSEGDYDDMMENLSLDPLALDSLALVTASPAPGAPCASTSTAPCAFAPPPPPAPPSAPRELPEFNFLQITSEEQLNDYYTRLLFAITNPLTLSIGDQVFELRVIHTGGEFLAFLPVVTLMGMRLHLIFRLMDFYFVAYLLPTSIPRIFDITPRYDYTDVRRNLIVNGYPDSIRIDGVDIHYTSLLRIGGQPRTEICLGRKSIDREIQLLFDPYLYITDTPSYATCVTSVCQFFPEPTRLKRHRAHVEHYFVDGRDDLGMPTPLDSAIWQHGWAIASFVLLCLAHGIPETHLVLRVEEGSSPLSSIALFDMIWALHPYRENDLRFKEHKEEDMVFKSKYHES